MSIERRIVNLEREAGIRKDDRAIEFIFIRIHDRHNNSRLGIIQYLPKNEKILIHETECKTDKEFLLYAADLWGVDVVTAFHEK